MEQELLRIEEVARRLDISRSKAYSLAATGTLPSVRVAGVVRVHRADLDAWLSSLRSQGTPDVKPATDGNS